MFEWLQRYRHGKGFGVHSPFAFRFITEVLGEKLPYYDYADITSPAARTLYRVACRFQPQTVRAVGGADASAALRACPRAQVWSGGAWQMAVADGSECDIAGLTAGHASDCVIVLTGHHEASLQAAMRWLDGKGCGMTFSNGRDLAVVVLDRKLPRQDFQARF